MNRLKKRWGIHSNWQVIVILTVFSVTGFSSLFIAKPIMEWINLSEATTNPWIYRPIRVVIIFLIYPVLIVSYGWIFGQYTFFSKFAKKMLSRFGLKIFAEKKA